jgi:hypothetical protein
MFVRHLVLMMLVLLLLFLFLFLLLLLLLQLLLLYGQFVVQQCELCVHRCDQLVDNKIVFLYHGIMETID